MRQVDEHIKPDRFVCLCDFGVFPSWIEPVPLLEGWPGWFSKIEAFRPGVFDGPTLLFDLDTLILGPIPGFERLENLGQGHTPPLALLDDFYRPHEPASGVLAWVPCEATERIYEEFRAKPQISGRWNRGDGWIIGKYDHVRLQRMFPGTFGSFKADKLQAGPKEFKVCCFHGSPKQHELPHDSWAYKHWIGATA